MKKEPKKKLRDYQVKALRYCKSVQHPALFMDMRLGKTLISLRAIKLYPLEEKRKILIVAPLSSFLSWKKELLSEKFNDFVFLHGSKKQRLQMLEEDHAVYVTNYEVIRPLKNELRKVNWNVVILDESTKIKNNSSNVGKYFTKNFRNVDHRFVLTGTPEPEKELDIINQLVFLDKSIIFGKDYWQFIKGCCTRVKFTTRIRPHIRNEFNKSLAKHCFFLKRSDVGVEQQRFISTQSCFLPPAIAKVYANVLKTMTLELDGITERAFFSMQRFEWCMRLASGFDNHGKLISRHKIDLLLEVLETQCENEPAIIWATRLHEIYTIEAELKAAKYKCHAITGEHKQSVRESKILDFMSGNIDILVINPEIMKYGADLTRAKNTIYFSLPLSNETFSQSRDRTVKVGSTVELNETYLIAADTIDEDILSGLENKTSRSDFFRLMIKKFSKN